MKFPGTCIVCNKAIAVNEVGLWAKGVGVKHEGCAQAGSEISCTVCGRPAGCAGCEFQDVCDIANVSQLCICKACSEKAGAAESYRRAAGKKFRIIDATSVVEHAGYEKP